MFGDYPAIASIAPLTAACCWPYVAGPTMSWAGETGKVGYSRGIKPIVVQTIYRLIGGPDIVLGGAIIERKLKTGTIILPFGFPPDFEMNVGMRQLRKIKTRAFNV